MEDDLPLSSSDPVEALEERAVAFAERAADRAGLTPPEDPIEAPEPVATREEGYQAPEPSLRNLPDPNEANSSWRARQEKAREKRVMEALLARFENETRNEPTPAQQAAEEEDPEPDPEVDYRGWMAWNNRQVKNGVLSELKPLLSAFEQEQQIRRQQAEVAQQRAYERGELDRRASIAREVSQAYMQTEEGRDFSDRLMFRFGDPGDPERGVAPIDGVETLGLVAAGLPQQLARHINFSNARALAEIFAQHGLDPAVAIDRFNRALIYGANVYYGSGYQQQGYQQEYQQQLAPQQRPQSRAAREVSQLRSTAQAAGAVAGSASEGGGIAAAPDVAQASRAGVPAMAKLKEIARTKYGGDYTRAARELRRLASGG